MREPTLGRALRAPGPPAPEVKGQQQPGSRYGAAPDPLAAPAEGALPQLGGETPSRRATGGGPSSSGATPSLMPTEEQLARAIGGGTQDALKDIDEGDETALNSKKWRFASFFNRVKKQVAEHWHPEEVYRRRDPTGAVYGHQNRYTLVRVQIRPDGTLANVSLEQPSGLEFLDDEAIEAFRQAQPFPNPPRQLLERSGLINFGLGFLLDLNGATKMHFFKY
jgi:TonB family protein